MADSISVTSCKEHLTITVLAHKGEGGLACQMGVETGLAFLETLQAEFEGLLEAMAHEGEKDQ